MVISNAQPFNDKIQTIEKEKKRTEKRKRNKYLQLKCETLILLIH